MLDFVNLYNRLVPLEQQFVGNLVVLDPGETTGFARFQCTKGQRPVISEYRQLPSNPIEHGINQITRILEDLPTKVVFEDYKVYAWKVNEHSWSALHTPELIGAIQTLCYQKKIPTHKQMAGEAKQFWSDKRLQDFGFYIPGQRHTRDAIRHGLYYLLWAHTKLRSPII